MKKGLKITLIIIVGLIVLILVDTLQAKVFNNSPLLKIREYYNGGETYYIDKGLLVNHYCCNDSEEKTLFKNSKYPPTLLNSSLLASYSHTVSIVISFSLIF